MGSAAKADHFTKGAPDSITLARNAEVCLASADHAECVTGVPTKAQPVFQGR